MLKQFGGHAALCSANNRYSLTLLLLLVGFLHTAHAVEPLPSDLIDFNSPNGYVMFHRSTDRNALKLLSQFTTQKTNSFCGVASAVMILNAVPKPSPLDQQHSPYHYFNQDNFFSDQVTRIKSPEEVQKYGLSLPELAKIIQCHGLKTTVHYASDLNLTLFRALLRKTIINQHFIIVNYFRTELGQKGGGHYSPIAAYDARTDRFLILDVARYKYPAFWVKTQTLWHAVNTVDASDSRGVIVSK